MNSPIAMTRRIKETFLVFRLATLLTATIVLGMLAERTVAVDEEYCTASGSGPVCTNYSYRWVKDNDCYIFDCEVIKRAQAFFHCDAEWCSVPPGCYWGTLGCTYGKVESAPGWLKGQVTTDYQLGVPNATVHIGSAALMNVCDLSGELSILALVEIYDNSNPYKYEDEQYACPDIIGYGRFEDRVSIGIVDARKHKPRKCDDSSPAGAGGCPTCGLGQGGGLLQAGDAKAEVLVTARSTQGCYANLLLWDSVYRHTAASIIAAGSGALDYYVPRIPLGDYYINPNNRDGWTGYWSYDVDGSGNTITQVSLTASDERIDQVYYYDLTGLTLTGDDDFHFPDGIPLKYIALGDKTVSYEYGTYNGVSHVTLQYDGGGNTITYEYEPNYSKLTKLVAKAADESTRAYQLEVDADSNITKVSSPCTSCGEVVYSYTAITGSGYPDEEIEVYLHEVKDGDGPSATVLRRYSYDDQGRITEVSRGSEDLMEEVEFDDENQRRTIKRYTTSSEWEGRVLEFSDRGDLTR